MTRGKIGKASQKDEQKSFTEEIWNHNSQVTNLSIQSLVLPGSHARSDQIDRREVAGIAVKPATTGCAK